MGPGSGWHSLGEWLTGTLNVLGIVAVIGGGIVAWRLFVRRRLAWLAFARSLGLSYSSSDPFRLLSAARYYPILRGTGRRVEHAVDGMYRGRGVRCFDYYRRPDAPGGFRIHTPATLVAVRAPVPFEPLVVHPTDAEERLADGVSPIGLHFESENFSRNFYVTATDRRFASALLHPRAMDLLLRHRSLAIEANSRQVLFYQHGGGLLPVPAKVQELLDTACDFLDLMPEYMLERGPRGPAAPADSR